MSDETPEDVEFRRAIRQATRRLEQKSDAERRTLIQQAVDQAMAEELAEKELESEREATAIHDALVRDKPEEEALRARRQAPSKILLLLLLLLILLLIATATGRSNILGFPGVNPPGGPQPTLAPQINGSVSSDSQVASISGRSANVNGMPAIGGLDAATPTIDDRFRAYYDQHGGEPIFGRPISPPLSVNGRTFQWFERARLEEWPEYANTPYAIQSGRLGVEFTKGIAFPKQTYFVSQPNIRYFAETEHGVRDRFLQFWEQNGGLDIFGYPIGDEVQEKLPDGQIHTVQYFERGRIEYHPQQAGTPFEMQIGLLGRALYLNESKPNIIPPPRPTPVPMP